MDFPDIRSYKMDDSVRAPPDEETKSLGGSCNG